MEIVHVHSSDSRGMCDVFAINFPLHRIKWQSMAAVCFYITLLVGCATPQRSVSIDSFRVLNVSSEAVDIELIVSNDGSKGEVCLGALAKSKDGSVRSDGSFFPGVPVGKKLHIARRVMRPHGSGKQQTDFLMVQVIPCGKKILLAQKFNWPYVWPEISTSGKSDENQDVGTIAPWFALLQNLSEEDFAASDMLMGRWNNTKERDKNGAWKLDSFRNAMYYLTQNSNWNEHIALIQKWRRLNRKSPWAAIAEANYWSSYAWHIRGKCTDCEDVDPVAIRVFHERMQRAEQVLIDSKGFASNNPLWYEAYLDIANDTKRDDKFIQSLFDEGVHKFPHYQHLYVVMSYRWTPLFGEKADWQKVEDLANFAVNLTSDTDGAAFYAWIYAGINFQLRLEVDILHESLVSWAKMRESFEDLVERYPSADNFNQFAAFACRADDKDAYLRVRPKIQGHIIPAKWPSNFPLDLCDHRFMQYS